MRGARGRRGRGHCDGEHDGEHRRGAERRDRKAGGWCPRAWAIGEATDAEPISTRAAAKMASAPVGSGMVSAASAISAESSLSVIISSPLG